MEDRSCVVVIRSPERLVLETESLTHEKLGHHCSDLKYIRVN
jgi:hypothetical protein